MASDLSLVLCRAAMELALSPFGVLLALTPGSAPRAGARSCGRDHWGQASAPPQPARDASYAAQLRRAAPVAHLFATAPPGGEREAAYHALARLAAAADASFGASPRGGAPPLTPGALYRDLTQGAPWRMPGVGVPAFDARVCAELDRRDAVA